MNNAGAREILTRELAPYCEQSYEQLCGRVGAGPRVSEVVGPSGTSYQIEVDAQWNSKPRGNVQVIGSIDDGGWRAFVPLSTSFIKAPDGSFVAE